MSINSLKIILNILTFLVCIKTNNFNNSKIFKIPTINIVWIIILKITKITSGEIVILHLNIQLRQKLNFFFKKYWNIGLKTDTGTLMFKNN